MYSSELYHHGVMGMKWGVRRYQPYGEGGYTPKDKNKEAKLNRREKKKNVRNLSDDEIRTEINRIKSEHELKRLINEDLNPGRTETMRILKQAGAKAATAAATGALLYAGKALVTRKFNAGEFAAFVFQKPKNK